MRVGPNQISLVSLEEEVRTQTHRGSARGHEEDMAVNRTEREASGGTDPGDTWIWTSGLRMVRL